MRKKHIVIIPTYNELATLKKMLAAYIKNTKLDECLTYIIDDASNTQTKDYLRQIVQNNKKIILQENKNNLGKPKSINQIIYQNKNADYFTIIDSDLQILSHDWQKTLLKAQQIFKNNAIIGGFTHQKGFEFQKNNITFGDTFPFWTLAGGFFSIPKAVFHKIGYFYDKIKRHEDADYCRRAATKNIRWYYTPDIKTKELNHTSFANKTEYKNLKQKEEKIYKQRSEYIMKSHDVHYDPYKI